MFLLSLLSVAIVIGSSLNLGMKPMQATSLQTSCYYAKFINSPNFII